MKLTPFTSAEEFAIYCAKSLKEAPKRRKSAFKYFSLNTITSVDGVLYPQSRMVVLREVFEKFDFHIYTDSRTEKVVSLDLHKEASALFYDPKKMVQIRLEGILEKVEDSQNYFESLSEPQKRDYRTKMAPGSQADSFHTIHESEGGHFQILRFRTQRFDLVQLHSEGHRRVKGSIDLKGAISSLFWVTP